MSQSTHIQQDIYQKIQAQFQDEPDYQDELVELLENIATNNKMTNDQLVNALKGNIEDWVKEDMADGD